ncbi:hypothetical protein OK351_17225 [Glutamicibacter sp. MNS18]|uniref:hypothetical protein n=1 Tax=Glutamicibacter sp. MNS18 TaxID=2989817 RepID=UPI0022364EB9|nr:hypothetical protein [Glutamicibacter sp. MNS18]MCW4467225.1 hypothetical protein [Glutamicibacter sp. MNS18]
MGTDRSKNIEIRSSEGHVEIVGMDEADVAEAIELFRLVRLRQAGARNALSDHASRVMIDQVSTLMPRDSQR